jgi:hypothetical protein
MCAHFEFFTMIPIKRVNTVVTMTLPSRTQSLKAAIVFDRDVTVKVSSKNELNVQNLIKTVIFFLVEPCVEALQLLPRGIKCH